MLASNVVIDAIYAAFQQAEISLYRVRGNGQTRLIADIFLFRVVHLEMLTAREYAFHGEAGIGHNLRFRVYGPSNDGPEIISRDPFDMLRVDRPVSLN